MALTPEQIEAIRARTGIQPSMQPQQSAPQTNSLAQRWAAADAAPKEEAPQETGLWDKYKKATQKATTVMGKGFGALVSSEEGFGHSIADAITASSNIDKITERKSQEQEMRAKVIKQIAENKKMGKDTTNLQWALKRFDMGDKTAMEELQNIAPSVNKTTKQILGEAGGVALDIAAFGTYGKAAKGLKSFEIGRAAPSAAKTLLSPASKWKMAGEALKTGAKAGTIGAGIGYGYDITQSMQANEDTGDIFTPGVGAALGFAIPMTIGIASAGKQLLFPSKEAALRSYKMDLEKTFSTKEAERKAIGGMSPKYKHNPVDLLVEKAAHGDLVPVENDHGIIRTKNAVDKLWRDVNEYEELLDAALASPEAKARPINIRQLENEVIQKISNEPKIRGTGNLQKAVSEVKKTFAGLRKTYGNTWIQPLQAQEIKKAKWNELRSLFGKQQATYLSDSQFYIAESFKDAIEKSLDDAPISKMNEYIGRHLELIKFLGPGGAEGKLAPGAGRLSRYFFRVIGMGIGGQAGPVGALMGAAGGDKAAGMLGSIPMNNMFRQAALEKIKYSDPRPVMELLSFMQADDIAAGLARSRVGGQGLSIPEQAFNKGVQAIKRGFTESAEDLATRVKEGRPPAGMSIEDVSKRLNKPQVLYHGSKNIDQIIKGGFDSSKSVRSGEWGEFGGGIFFSETEKGASQYGQVAETVFKRPPNLLDGGSKKAEEIYRRAQKLAASELEDGDLDPENVGPFLMEVVQDSGFDGIRLNNGTGDVVLYNTDLLKDSSIQKAGSVSKKNP